MPQDRAATPTSLSSCSRSADRYTWKQGNPSSLPPERQARIASGLVLDRPQRPRCDEYKHKTQPDEDEQLPAPVQHLHRERRDQKLSQCVKSKCRRDEGSDAEQAQSQVSGGKIGSRENARRFHDKVGSAPCVAPVVKKQRREHDAQPIHRKQGHKEDEQ